ncbi:hypothetical protein Goshw_000527 [Gossypium schwendimanii]|uniref:Uncharacterized protein n=1 Tax=Gossypium schwendimanii TaxID=34291 RepID=A0A7J9LJG3_GOSSC|nr:hypothetical protein [Gossypium schwendimanii]
MAVLMAIKEAAEMIIELIRKEQPWSFRNLFSNIEGSLRRMAKVQIEVTIEVRMEWRKPWLKQVCWGIPC